MTTLRNAGSARISTHADLLELYWKEIRENEPLSREEEAELFREVKGGNQEAVEKLVEANLRFVVSVAREYCPEDGPALMDLIAEGNMGLMRAIKTFDETRGFKFITYAVWWIRQAMRKMLHNYDRSMRLPSSHVNDLQLIEKEAAILSQELGRNPTFDEIAERVEMGPERLHNALEAGTSDMSLDAPLFAEEETSLMAVFPVEDAASSEIEEEKLMQTLQESLEILSERELMIVQTYFGLNGAEAKTLEEIGRELGVTRERVRQLRNRALAKMRAQFGDLLLELSVN
jgi:RNA polymerase primary sigma factor